MGSAGWRDRGGGRSAALKSLGCVLECVLRGLAVLWGQSQQYRALAVGSCRARGADCFSAGLARAPAAAMPRSWLGWSSVSATPRWCGKVWPSPMARAEGDARCRQAWRMFLLPFRKPLYLELTGRGYAKLSVLINKASVDGVQAKPVNSLYLWISVCHSIYINL